MRGRGTQIVGLATILVILGMLVLTGVTQPIRLERSIKISHAPRPLQGFYAVISPIELLTNSPFCFETVSFARTQSSPGIVTSPFHPPTTSASLL